MCVHVHKIGLELYHQTLVMGAKNNIAACWAWIKAGPTKLQLAGGSFPLILQCLHPVFHLLCLFSESVSEGLIGPHVSQQLAELSGNTALGGQWRAGDLIQEAGPLPWTVEGTRVARGGRSEGIVHEVKLTRVFFWGGEGNLGTCETRILHAAVPFDTPFQAV